MSAQATDYMSQLLEKHIRPGAERIAEIRAGHRVAVVAVRPKGFARKAAHLLGP